MLLLACYWNKLRNAKCNDKYSVGSWNYWHVACGRQRLILTWALTRPREEKSIRRNPETNRKILIFNLGTQQRVCVLIISNKCTINESPYLNNFSLYNINIFNISTVLHLYMLIIMSILIADCICCHKQVLITREILTSNGL